MDVALPIIRWIIAVPCGLIFAVLFVGHWSTIIAAAFRRTDSGFSLIPLVGPAAGLIFFFTIPLNGVAQFWWVVLLDATILLPAVFGPLNFLYDRFRPSDDELN